MRIARFFAITGALLLAACIVACASRSPKVKTDVTKTKTEKSVEKKSGKTPKVEKTKTD